MRPNVAVLVGALDAAQVSDGATLEEVARVLECRAGVIAQIMALDGAGLDDEDREALRAAIGRAQERDAQLMSALTREQSKTTEALADLVEARGAARGYRGARRQRGSVLRTA